MKYTDKFRACLVGGAIGDALGYPIEFISLSEIKQRYGKDGLQNLIIDSACGKALVSDDTQMTLFLQQTHFNYGKQLILSLKNDKMNLERFRGLCLI